MAPRAVTVDGLEFERSALAGRRGGVTYVAVDGVRLRSKNEVEKYLKSVGLVSSLPDCLVQFNFDMCDTTETVGLKAPSMDKGKSEALDNAKDTPVKAGAESSTKGAVPLEWQRETSRMYESYHTCHICWCLYVWLSYMYIYSTCITKVFVSACLHFV